MEGGAYARDKLKDSSKHPLPTFAQSSVQKGGTYFQKLMVNYYVFACYCLCKLDRSLLHYEIRSESV